jgi:hypothetical protein
LKAIKIISLILLCWYLPVSLVAQSIEEIKKPLTPVFEQQEIQRPPADLNLDPFYKKYADAGGIPIISSEKTSDDALLVAAAIVNYMLQKRDDIRTELTERKCKVLVMAPFEALTDLPEYRDRRKPLKDDKRLTDRERENYDKPGGIGGMTDREYWNQRSRGMGGSNVTSCAEENLLGYDNDRYYGENIFIHEFSHTIFFAIQKIDPDLYAEVESAYKAAKNNEMYKGQYAINTLAEYWAEGTQWWFWSNYEFYDGETRVQSPEDLAAYDPTLYHLLEQVYEGHQIPADVYYGQNLKRYH